MGNLFANWRWLIPLLAYSADAHAWGFYTHVYFAQQLLWAIPLTDPRYHRAIRRLPTLLLAGACLPDLSLVAGRFGLGTLRDSHVWDHAHRLLHAASDDAGRAIAVGYASHLLVDIIAHNHFVPAHEHMWADIPVATHAVSEWAMDHHVGKHLYLAPADLMRRHERELASHVASQFGCSADSAGKALRMLAAAETALRRSGIPRLCHGMARAADVGMRRRFNYYLRQTTARLPHINRILAGEAPRWPAEAPFGDMARRFETLHPLKLRHRIPLPHDLFVSAECRQA